MTILLKHYMDFKTWRKYCLLLEMLPIEKYNNIAKMKWSACHERGTKKKSEFLTGFEPMISQTPGRGSTHVIYELFFTMLLFV